MMDTEHAVQAIKDQAFYQSIVAHRQQFNKVTGIDYTLHSPAYINFIPQEKEYSDWEADYKVMQENMIYGESLAFKDLIGRLIQLRSRFRGSVKE